MVLCRLCGYQGQNNTNAQCPVCGEVYDRLQDGYAHGSVLAQAAGDSWFGVSQQKPRIGGLDGCNTEAAAKGSTYLNLDLQYLLYLIPEQQDRKKRAQRDVVRATEAGLAPTQANNGRHGAGVVYIQPRVDPTMTVLKGRYKTQPRLAKATSMSVLSRLADPLMGYDSMGALAPKARKRRQESAERILGQALSSEKLDGGGQARRLNKSRSAVELSAPLARNAFLRRRSSGGVIPPRAPMAVSVSAVHLYSRKNSVGSGAHQRRQQDRCGGSGGRLSQTDEVAAASQLLRLRANRGRRVKPNLRRKRVATMRSVDGWVRESDPTSTRRRVSLNRRMVALRKKQNQKPRGKKEEGRSVRNSVNGGARRHSNHDGGSTFLTEIETDGALRVPETGLSRGNGGIGGWVNGSDVPRRRSSVKANASRQHPRAGEGGSISATAQRQQARRRSSGAESPPPSTEARRRRATVSANTRGRSRSEGARVKARAGRTKSVGALGGHDDQQTSPSRRGQSSARIGAGERVPEGRARQAPALPAPPPPQPLEWSAETSSGRVVMGNSADGTPSHPGGAWTLPSPGRITDYDPAPGAAELAVRSSAINTDAYEADITMAPAWGVVGSYAALPMPEDVGARLAWQGGQSDASIRPRSEWQLLRDGGANSLSRSAELLRSFENKVGSPVSKDQGRRPASATAATSTAPQQQPLLSEGEHAGGRRHRHHGPLSRGGGEEEGKQDGTPPFPSKSSLASMHNRPGSSSWVHRRSLPSLLSSGTTEGSTRTQRTKAAWTLPSDPSGGGAAARKRGKRRTPLEEPSGRMRCLDKTSTTMTVREAFARSGASLNASGGGRGWKSSGTETVSPGSFGEGGEAARAATPPPVESRRGASASSGKLLSNAIPKPLLYIGSGGGYRLRS